MNRHFALNEFNICHRFLIRFRAGFCTSYFFISVFSASRNCYKHITFKYSTFFFFCLKKLWFTTYAFLYVFWSDLTKCVYLNTLLSFQSGQPVFPSPNQQPPPSQATPPSAPSGPAPTTTPQPASGGAETLSPELFTGIVQGVLSTMMGSLGAGQGNTESIAQFIQRLSQTSNLFTPGAGDAVGGCFCVPLRQLKNLVQLNATM